MLPDRSVLIGQKLVENAKFENFKCDILGDFQTLCKGTRACFCPQASSCQRPYKSLTILKLCRKIWTVSHQDRDTEVDNFFWQLPRLLEVDD